MWQVGGEDHAPVCPACVASAMTFARALVWQHVGTWRGAQVWRYGLECVYVCVGMWQDAGVHFSEHGKDAHEPSRMCTLRGTHPCAGPGAWPSREESCLLSEPQSPHLYHGW